MAPAIRRFAEERTSNALVVGTHARSGMAGAFIGSTAERLMQISGVPVIATHADDTAETGPIAVAHDGKHAANAALRVAIDMARSQRRGLAIINIVQGGRESRLASQPTADAIVEAAERQHSPMIVVGTRGRTDLVRMLLGSVSAAVVEKAHVPVTVVREA